ncbi:MAG: Ribosomal RNA small subunit methyltransferase E [Owenweeksia sp. TMED14]|nr:MAG: Ribosomal RNA small subunit methyltransferase E [Owenweeksia sp. TMED14]|tara:strand:- start:845 stop:1558 length:714 start_codon:yes stop_codon:yes gene_type:complete
MHNFWGELKDNKVFLDQEEIPHAIKSLRLELGDLVRVFDGSGNTYTGSIDTLSRKSIRISDFTIDSDLGLVNGHLHMAMSPTKNIDRWNFFLEKAVEIGVHEITPVLSHRSERRFLNHDRSLRIIRSACLQSQKSSIPKLNESIGFKEFIDTFKLNFMTIATCHDSDKIDLNEVIRIRKSDEVLIAIGPEGDFTDEELQYALLKGYIHIGLGVHRLRTETAGIYAVSAFAQRDRIDA